MSVLTQYKKAFARLNPNRNRHNFPVQTGHTAPHKPFLLMAVMDLLAGGVIRTNRIEPNQDLIDAFLTYWDEIMGPGRTANIGLPFHHLASQGFWHPLRRSDAPNSVPSSARQLQRTYECALLDQPLFELILNPMPREDLRKVLIETYFDSAIQPRLWELATISADAMLYAGRLIAACTPEEYGQEESPVKPVRDQGFRRAVVRIYENRCALCGIRMITPEGHTVVDAAHIKDWSVSHNDHPTNGFALCKLCHWSFDQGLVAVTDSYRVDVSKVIRQDPNLPGHLASFQDRDIILPGQEHMYPNQENLHWHRENRFLG